MQGGCPFAPTLRFGLEVDDTSGSVLVISDGDSEVVIGGLPGVSTEGHYCDEGGAVST